MSKLVIPYVEFYITNVCNLSCSGCNRFNNYNFGGYQRWESYSDQYAQWANQIDVGSIGILGGEPLLNPTVMDWITGISQLWPNRLIRIISNGFQLNKVSGLYDLMSKNSNIQLWLGIHNKTHKKEIFEIVQQFMSGHIQFQFDETNPYQQYLWATDSNGVKIKIEYNWWFHQGAIRHVDGQQMLHESLPDKAHDICHMKTCHHFIRGKLYKCGVVALLPEFDQQYPFALSPDDRVMLHSYQPLTLQHTHEQKQMFIEKLTDPIDQCKFCPEVYHGQQIFALKKKDLAK